MGWDGMGRAKTTLHLTTIAIGRAAAAVASYPPESRQLWGQFCCKKSASRAVTKLRRRRRDWLAFKTSGVGGDGGAVASAAG